MTTIPAHTRPLVMRIALQRLKALKERQRQYEEYCRDMAAQGYRPEVCFHGTNLWVDYDPICGPCEDGSPLARVALDTARYDVATFLERQQLACNAIDAGIPLASNREVYAWVREPLEDWSGSW
jgi:hypothetical protein